MCKHRGEWPWVEKDLNRLDLALIRMNPFCAGNRSCWGVRYKIIDDAYVSAFDEVLPSTDADHNLTESIDGLHVILGVVECVDGTLEREVLIKISSTPLIILACPVVEIFQGNFALRFGCLFQLLITWPSVSKGYYIFLVGTNRILTT